MIMGEPGYIVGLNSTPQDAASHHDHSGHHQTSPTVGWRETPQAPHHHWNHWTNHPQVLELAFLQAGFHEAPNQSLRIKASGGDNSGLRVCFKNLPISSHLKKKTKEIHSAIKNLAQIFEFGPTYFPKTPITWMVRDISGLIADHPSGGNHWPPENGIFFRHEFDQNRYEFLQIGYKLECNHSTYHHDLCKLIIPTTNCRSNNFIRLQSNPFPTETDYKFSPVSEQWLNSHIEEKKRM